MADAAAAPACGCDRDAVAHKHIECMECAKDVAAHLSDQICDMCFLLSEVGLCEGACDTCCTARILQNLVERGKKKTFMLRIHDKRCRRGARVERVRPPESEPMPTREEWERSLAMRRAHVEDATTA
jgi:hypothetical protein